MFNTIVSFACVCYVSVCIWRIKYVYYYYYYYRYLRFDKTKNAMFRSRDGHIRSVITDGL